MVTSVRSGAPGLSPPAGVGRLVSTKVSVQLVNAGAAARGSRTPPIPSESQRSCRSTRRVCRRGRGRQCEGGRDCERHRGECSPHSHPPRTNPRHSSIDRPCSLAGRKRRMSRKVSGSRTRHEPRRRSQKDNTHGRPACLVSHARQARLVGQCGGWATVGSRRCAIGRPHACADRHVCIRTWQSRLRLRHRQARRAAWAS